MFQDNRHSRWDICKGQRARLALIQESVMLHHAGRSPSSTLVSRGGHDVLRQPETGRENALVKERGSGKLPSGFPRLSYIGAI